MHRLGVGGYDFWHMNCCRVQVAMIYSSSTIFSAGVRVLLFSDGSAGEKSTSW